jgi:hypothetical protein
MANDWYNPYDSGIQWGDGIAQLIEANKDKILQLIGMGGGGKGGGGRVQQGGGPATSSPIGAGGEGYGDPQKNISSDLNTGFTGQQSGSPAGYVQAQGQQGQMTPEMQKIIAAIMQAMSQGGNI